MTDRTALADELDKHRKAWLCFFGTPNGDAAKDALTEALMDDVCAIIAAFRAEPAKPVDREAVALAIMKATGCWFMHKGERVFCDHPLFDGPNAVSDCRIGADAAIAAMGGE